MMKRKRMKKEMETKTQQTNEEGKEIKCYNQTNVVNKREKCANTEYIWSASDVVFNVAK